MRSAGPCSCQSECNPQRGIGPPPLRFWWARSVSVQIINVRSISPLRLAKDTWLGKAVWRVVYPWGEVNPLMWRRKSDAIGQANIACPYFQEKK